jgi:hypothetical protein
MFEDKETKAILLVAHTPMALEIECRELTTRVNRDVVCTHPRAFVIDFRMLPACR